MGGRLLALLLVVPACSAKLADAPFTDTPPLSDEVDAGLTADGPVVVPTFGAPAKHSAASATDRNEDDGTMTGDGLEMVFSIQDPLDGNRKHLWVTKRASVTATWGAATRLDAINMLGTSDETPRFADNGTTLFFASGRSGTSLDIWRSTRASTTGAWTTPTIVAGVDSASLEKTYTPCGGRYLVVVGGDIHEGLIGGAPVPATVLNDPATNETGPFLTPDCLTVYFASPRGGGPGKIYTSSRASITSAWSAPALYTDYLQTATVAGSHEDPWFSDDGAIFSFAANPDGTKDQYIVTR